MGKTFSADVSGWCDKALRNADLVLAGSVSDLGEIMTRRAEGVSAGGTHQEGFVPVVTGELINSQEVAINGGVIATGAIDYTAVVSSLKLGDSIEAVFTAPHARPKEYGHGTAPGWFFVRNAVQQWVTVVEMNARIFKD